VSRTTGSLQAAATATAPVAKLQLPALARALPARSRTAVETVTAKLVAAASGAEGVKVTVLPATAALTGTPTPAACSVTLAAVTVDGSIASENMIETTVPLATALAPAAGTDARSVGAVLSTTGAGSSAEPPPHAASTDATRDTAAASRRRTSTRDSFESFDILDSRCTLKLREHWL